MINVVILILLFGFLVYGFILVRGITLADYASFRNKADFKKILYSLLSSLIGGWMFFGLSAIGFEAGIVGYIIGIAYALGLLLLGYLSPKIKNRMRGQGSDTLDDFVGTNHGLLTQSVVTFLNLLFFLSILAAQFIALSSFLALFTDFESTSIYYISALVVIVYTATAGFKGVLLTDTYQFWIISVCVLVVTISIMPDLNIQNLNDLPQNYFNGLGYGGSFLVGIFLFLPLSMLVRSDLWQRISSAQDEKQVKKAFYFASPVIFLFYVLLTNMGIAAKASGLNIVNAETSGLELFLSVSSTNLFGSEILTYILIMFVSLGILSALVSTMDTYLNISAIISSKLIFSKKWKAFNENNQNTGLERNILISTGVLSIMLGLIGVVLSKLIPDLVNLIVSAASIVMVFIPSIIGALIYGDKSPKLSILSIFGGVFSFIVLAVLLNDPKTAMLPGVLVSFLMYFIPKIFKKD